MSYLDKVLSGISKRKGGSYILIERVQANENYNVRTKMHQGRSHLIVPVVMMVEGVHSGSHGPLFHPREELGRYPESWNGIPVMIEHPAEGGENVSANSPELIEGSSVGRTYNTRMDGDKLRAEVWLDEERLRKESPSALEYIQQGLPLEVSVGVFTDEEYRTGDYKGEHYESIARNHRPDHLALLPEGVGACSWVDGCGIRTNTNDDKKGGKSRPMKNEQFEALKTQKAEDVATLVEKLVANQRGYKELINGLQRKLDAMDTGDRLHYLTEVYDENFIYEVRKRDGEPAFYKRGYQVNDDGSIEFGEEPEEVRRQIDFVTLEKGNKKLIRTKFSNNFSKKEVTIMSETKKDPCCEDLVKALIANERTKFTEEDKEVLLTMEEEFLTRLVPDKPVVKKEPEKLDKQDPPQINAEQAMKVLKEQITKPEEFIKLLPADMQDSLSSGLRLHQDKRTDMVDEILDFTTDGTWSKEELEAMRFETLEKVHQSISKPVDYTVLGDTGRVKTQEGVIPLYPAGVEFEKENVKKG